MAPTKVTRRWYRSTRQDSRPQETGVEHSPRLKAGGSEPRSGSFLKSALPFHWLGRAKSVLPNGIFQMILKLGKYRPDLSRLSSYPSGFLNKLPGQLHRSHFEEFELIGKLDSHLGKFVFDSPVHIKMFLRRQGRGDIVALLILNTHRRIRSPTFIHV